MTLIFSCAIIPIDGGYEAILITKDERKMFVSPSRAEVLDQVFYYLVAYEKHERSL